MTKRIKFSKKMILSFFRHNFIRHWIYFHENKCDIISGYIVLIPDLNAFLHELSACLLHPFLLQITRNHLHYLIILKMLPNSITCY